MTITSYRIRLKEPLDRRWQAFFSLTLSTIEIEGQALSELKGPLDQSALHGTLQAIRDLNLHLLSVDIEKVEAAYHTLYPPFNLKPHSDKVTLEIK